MKWFPFVVDCQSWKIEKIMVSFCQVLLAEIRFLLKFLPYLCFYFALDNLDTFLKFEVDKPEIKNCFTLAFITCYVGHVLEGFGLDNRTIKAFEIDVACGFALSFLIWPLAKNSN